jgi:nucleotide-binding universal stress UspA family protein
MSVEGTIVEYAERQGVDLIVIGTTGRSGFKKLLLGSVASGVVNYATCPVMVVK